MKRKGSYCSVSGLTTPRANVSGSDASLVVKSVVVHTQIARWFYLPCVCLLFKVKDGMFNGELGACRVMSVQGVQDTIFQPP